MVGCARSKEGCAYSNSLYLWPLILLKSFETTFNLFGKTLTHVYLKWGLDKVRKMERIQIDVIV